MSKIFQILTIFVCFSLTTSKWARKKRIVDSHDVDYKDYRYMVFIVGQFPHKAARQGCSGTIISDKVILTAAHCVYQDGYKATEASVILEFNITNTRPITLKVDDMYAHPNYIKNPMTYMYDVALLTLHDSIPDLCHEEDSPKISTLYLDHGQGLEYQTCHSVGWGLTESGNLSSSLRKVNIENMDRMREKHEICLVAFYEGYGKLCAGDSGGPLICETENGQIQIAVNSQIYQSAQPTKREAVDEVIAFCRSAHLAIFTEIEASMEFIQQVLKTENLWDDFEKYQNSVC